MKSQKRAAKMDGDFEAPAGQTTKATHEEISALAHKLYEEAGCPSGCHEAHWKLAESRLYHESFDH